MEKKLPEKEKSFVLIKDYDDKTIKESRDEFLRNIIDYSNNLIDEIQVRDTRIIKKDNDPITVEELLKISEKNIKIEDSLKDHKEKNIKNKYTQILKKSILMKTDMNVFIENFLIYLRKLTINQSCDPFKIEDIFNKDKTYNKDNFFI